MRSLSRAKQKIWFSRISEKLDGIDTVQRYSQPFVKLLTVSATSGTPEELSAGVVPDYDRYITWHKVRNCSCLNLDVKESDVCWVDITPEIDESGNLVMGEDGVTPTTPPDYVVKKVLQSKTQDTVRFGISRIKGAE